MLKKLLKNIDCMRVARMINKLVKKNTSYKKDVINGRVVYLLIEKIEQKQYKHDILVQISIFLNTVSKTMEKDTGVSLFTMYYNIKGLKNDLRNSIYKILRKYKKSGVE